ncbi:amino acid transporter [Streptococcus pluranimalium]|uniref:amino acid transporter n=1 Tax=Streptococcus pluranimalium TaxID=82348 RepID=UPI0039FD52A4
MNKLLVIFKSIIGRKDVKILFSFSLLPVITPFLMGNQELETLTFSDFTSSLFSFFAGAIDTQYKLIIPTLIMGFIVCSVFREEIDSKVMFLYKDISRDTIYNLKITSLLMVYGLYLLISLATSAIAYFGVIGPIWEVPTKVLPEIDGVFSSNLLSILSTVVLNIITILLISSLSLRKGTLPSVLLGVLFTLCSILGEMLNWLSPIFPNGYVKSLGVLPFSTAACMIVLLSLIYSGVPYVLGMMTFRTIEY